MANDPDSQPVDDEKKKVEQSDEQTLEKTFADELGIVDLSEPIAGGRGRLFSVAGRDSPVAEFTNEFLVLHAPQKPFAENGPLEIITKHEDSRGILLDELGQEKRIPGAHYNGRQLYWLAQYREGTLKHIAGWLDDDEKIHRLLDKDEPMLVTDAFRLRNKTHDGELNIYPHLTSE